jgi:aminodeoxyfutalosine deaminase
MTAAAFAAALPKVELHLHLLGATSPATVATLAARYPEPGVPADPGELTAFYRFTGFAHFIEVYTAVNRLVGTAEDVVTLVEGLTGDLLRQNVRYAEVTVTPLSHIRTGVDPQELAAALDTGRRAAGNRGLTLAWVFDASADDGPPGAESTVDWVLAHAPPATVAFGLGGPEQGYPRRAFAGAFARAKANGLRSAPHAGETTGPGEVRAAARDLRADRIGHGLGAAVDPGLLAELADAGTALEICPTSNLRTGAVGSWAEHPLPAIAAAGVPVVLGSDDPGMFATSLTAEYLRCHDELGFDRAGLLGLARTAIDAAFCDAALAAALRAELDAFAAGG